MGAPEKLSFRDLIIAVSTHEISQVSCEITEKTNFGLYFGGFSDVITPLILLRIGLHAMYAFEATEAVRIEKLIVVYVT